jgi:ABC-type dipeptide/oligopeptide/nickel transport system permease component
MSRYLVQRLLSTVPVVLAVLTIIFVVVRALPGDPAQVALGDQASQEAVAALRTRLGLDAPLPVQYVRFLADLLRGDLGVSLINGTPVRDQVGYNLPFTLQLTLAALGFGILLGVPFGLFGALHKDRLGDLVGRVLSLVGLSVPAFYLGILLMVVFAVQLRWLPAVGGGRSGDVADVALSLVLPSLTLGLVMTASVARLTRAAMLGGLKNEYVRTARAKGLPERTVLLSHTLRPVLLPIVSLTGVWAVVLIGDSVTTELVFARPGLGKLLVGAVLQRDYTAVQSVMVVYALFVVCINLVIDLAYGLVDPRARR